MVFVQHVQVPALYENPYDALDIFVLNGQVQRGSPVNILSMAVRIVLLSQEPANVDVPLSCSPVQTRHLLIIDIKCQFRITLKQIVNLFIAGPAHQKEVHAVVKVMRLLYDSLVLDDLLEGNIFFLHLLHYLFDFTSEP